MVQHMLHQFLRWPLVLRILIIALSVNLLFGAFITIVEPKSFPTLFDGIWWAIITTSTVGYGDFHPTSVEGRIIAIMLIFVGAGFLSTYFITLATNAVTTQNAYLQGKATYSGEGHIIIIGWNERSREVINQLMSLQQGCNIILIDESLKENPYKDYHIHFVKGTPFKDDVLRKANLSEASKVIITADQNKDETNADMSSVLTLLAIKGNMPNLYTVVEILTDEQIANAERAGADEIIQTNKQTSYVMMNSIVSQGMSKAILKLLNNLKGNNLRLLPVSAEWVNLSFEEVSILLLKNNILLLGIKRGENTDVNPPLHVKVELEDALLVIST
jgi:voltage-gated potassium channel